MTPQEFEDLVKRGVQDTEEGLMNPHELFLYLHYLCNLMGRK